MGVDEKLLGRDGMNIDGVFLKVLKFSQLTVDTWYDFTACENGFIIFFKITLFFLVGKEVLVIPNKNV